MDNSTLDTVQKDITEIEKFVLEAKRPNIQRALREHLILLQGNLKHEKERLAEIEKNKSVDQTTSSTHIDSKMNYVSLSKYAFDNSDKFAKVYFTDNFDGLKSHPKEKITSNFTETSFEVCVHEWKGKNLRFACANLNKNINATDSYAKATGSGLTVYLRKTKQESWDSLEKKKNPMGGEGDKNPMMGGQDNKDDPSSGMMNMMKEMYQNGDDNTKRMIAESWMKAQDGKGGEGGMPGMGGMGGMPGMGGMGGGMPGMGGMGGGMPGMGGMGGGMPGMGGMGGGMPGMGGQGGQGGMPDMSKLAELQKMMGGMGGKGGMGGQGGKEGMPDMSKMMEMMGGMGGQGGQGGKEGMPDMSKMMEMMGQMGGKGGMPDMGDMEM